MKIKPLDLPVDLKQKKRWLALKETKAPMIGAWQKPQNWSNLQDIYGCGASMYGFVLTGYEKNGKYLVCLDFDKVADKNGNLPQKTKELIHHIETVAGGTYTEKSISGRGYHLFLWVSQDVFEAYKDDKQIRIKLGEKLEPSDTGFCNGIEVFASYQGNRFIAITGNIVDGAPTTINGGAETDTIIAGMLSTAREQKEAQQKKVSGTVQNETVDSADGVIQRIRQSKQADKFSSLFDRGDVVAYGGDNSSADMALMDILAFWTQCDKSLMQEIFLQSALAKTLDERKKGHKANYITRTIDEAVQGCGAVYQPTFQKSENAIQFTEQDEKELLSAEDSETGNVMRLKRLFGGEIAFNGDASRGVQWLRWNGKYWKPSPDCLMFPYVREVNAKMKDLLCKQVAATTDADDAKQYLGRLKKYVSMNNTKKIENVLEGAKSELYVDNTNIDKDVYLLNVQNGVLDLRTGDLLPHSQKFMCTKIARANYKPELIGKPSLWTRTVAEIFPSEEMQEYMQKWAGYMLTGSTEAEQALLLYGKGGAGKGTFINSISYMLGQYAQAVDIEIFLSSRNDGSDGGSKPSPQIAALNDVRLAVGSESGISRRFNSAKLKNLTGRDEIAARFLYGQIFTFKPTTKFVLQSNYLPHITDTEDTGVQRRLVIVPFGADLSSHRDVSLKSKLQEQDNLDSILAWCMEGWQKYQAEGLPNPQEQLDQLPQEIKRQMSDYYEENDVIGQFLEEYCVVADDTKKSPCRVKKSEFVRRFKEWNTQMQGTELSRNTIGDVLKNKGICSKKRKEGWFFTGVRFKNESEQYGETLMQE